MLKKIITGGQTGADLAGLDAAIRHGIPHGGWIPKGRRTESGPLPDSYNLKEMPGTGYANRTKQNIVDSDATLIIAHGELTHGSALTRDLAQQHEKPCLFLDMNTLSIKQAAKITGDWLQNNCVATLNVAGPRASKDPRIYKTVSQLLDTIFK